MKRLPDIVRCREMVHLEVELIGDVVPILARSQSFGLSSLV